MSFSAERFQDKLGIVYQTDNFHLYRIEKDGTGVRQITFGNLDDIMPCSSADGRSILVWKGSEQEEGPYKLYSVKPDGTDLHRLAGAASERYPDVGEARAFERLQIYSDRSKRFALRFLHQKDAFGSASRSFSRDGSKALVFPEKDKTIRIVDLEKRTVTNLNAKYGCPAWLDDDRLAVLVGAGADDDPSSSDPDQVAILNSKGRLLQSTDIENVKDDDETIGPDFLQDQANRSAFTLWRPGLFLWQAHHAMSDGGYTFTNLVDMKKGSMRSIGERGTADVSPGRTAFLTTEQHWVGGYKGAGAQKLSRLFLWDAQTMNPRPIGFRLMICLGACFVSE